MTLGVPLMTVRQQQLAHRPGHQLALSIKFNQPLSPLMETLQRDPYLWQKAKARAKFQSHLLTYLWVNGLLWAIWALTDAHFSHGLPWPIWSTVFWGIGLVMNGIAAYGTTTGLSREQRTQREYERLMQEQGRTADPLDKYR
jgi:hypothetical protein